MLYSGGLKTHNMLNKIGLFIFYMIWNAPLLIVMTGLLHMIDFTKEQSFCIAFSVYLITVKSDFQIHILKQNANRTSVL